MKKNINYIQRTIFILFTGIFMLTSNNSLLAQNCNQPEILYNQPDCFKPKEGAVPTQGRDCVPVMVCVNQQYTYTAGGGAWASYLWTITSGPATPPINPNATSANININWPVVGTYILTLTVTDGAGNIYTKCIEVIVKEKPIAGFTFGPNNACAGSTVNFLNATVYSGTASYSWNFGDPLSGPYNVTNAPNPSHQFSGPGTFIVTLIAYSTMLVPNINPIGLPGDSMTLVTCCADTIKKTVTVLAGNVKIECISTVCAGAKATYTAVGCGSPVWGTPIGGTIQSTSGNTITILWGNGNPQGQLSVSCGGCTAYVTIPIVPTTPVITGNLAPCSPGMSTYSVPYLPGTGYTWTLTNITTASNANNLLSTYPDNNTVLISWPSTTDTYQLTINLNNKHLCCTSTSSITITPKGKFTVYGPSLICQGQNGTFSTSPGGTFNWLSNPTGGVSPSFINGAPSFSAVFANTGTFVITATNVSSAFCNTTAVATVKVVPVPVPGTIQGPLTACAGNQYAYNMSSPAPAGFYYEWTITNGTFEPGGLTTTTGDNVTVQWTTLSGTITVVLRQTAAPNCSISAGSISVTAAIPGAITGTLSVCVDGTGTYSVTGFPSGTAVTWSITPASLGTIISGQGTTGPITVLWHGQVGAGPWGPANISATSGCGSAIPLGGIMIYPKFTFTINTTGLDICQPGGMTLTATGAPGGTTFIWTPGGPGPSININTTGSYSVTGINGGCSFTQQINIPDPFAIVPITCGVGHCNALATNEQLGVQVIKPGSGIFTYEWHSGTCTSLGPILATSTSGALSNSYTALADGNYCVIVKYGNCQKCLNFVVKKVCCPDVNNPVVTNTTQVTCDTYSFTGTTPNPTGATITWDFGDGTNAPGVSGVPISHTYANAGIYCVTFCVGPPSPNLTNCTGNCATTTAIVPIAAGFSYKLGCNGCLEVTNLSAVFGNPAFVTYLWNFGDATTSTLQNPPQHCYANGGSYVVTLTVTYNDGTISCTKTATQTVIYTPLDISISGPVCTGQPITFSSTPGGFVTYAWNFGDGFTAYTSPTTHIYNAPGIYTVTLSVTDLLGNTCTKTKKDTVLAGINNCTILPAYLCPGYAATLFGPAGTYTYAWEVEVSLNVFAPAAGINNTVNYTTFIPGFYRVIVTNVNGCTCTSNKVEVKAVPKPKASFSISPSKNLCAPGSMVTLSAPMITGYTYNWLANGNPAGGGALLMTFVSNTTVYTLIVKNQYGCKDTCIQTITVNALPAQPIITGTGSCEGVPITLTVNNYASNITWNNGANTTSIVVYTAGTYVATYTDPVTGCSNSATYTVNRRPSAGLFPHFCDSIPCNCIRPFVIYAPNPLIGIFASNYNINWYNANTNALLGSGNSYNNGGLGVQTGSYYIIITDQTTGCKDTSNNYSIVVPKCDTCDCKESKWGDIKLTPGENPVANNPAVGGNATLLKCNNNYTLECNKPFSINATYLCKDSACNGNVTYSLQPPTGLPITGNLALNFTPNQTGVYILTLYGWCGGKKCDSCIIEFTVKCDPCDCKGSKWGDIVLTQGIKDNNGDDNPALKANLPVQQKLKCNGSYKLDCNKPVTINTSFNCKDSACNGNVTYSLQPPTGLPITGNLALTFTPTQSGIYVLTMYGWCGGKICDSCVIKFEVKCEPCDCKGSKWGEKTVSDGVNIQQLTCNKEYTWKCKVPFTVAANYICAKPDCPGTVSYTLTPSVGVGFSGMLPLTYTPVQSGTYTLVLYGMCGGTICDSCVIRFVVDCPPEPCCPYTITVKEPTVQLSTISNPDATVANSNFAITGPAGNLFTEIRAEVMSYNLFSNFKNECLSCKSYPYTWASIYKAGNIGAIQPKITMFNSTTTSFNPAGIGMYQNPREVIWSGNPPFALPNNINIQFLLPPASIIDCCELTAKICVKFTFRDKNCKECEVISCFTVIIKPAGGHDDDKACNCSIKPVFKYESNGGQTGSKNVNCGETIDLFAGSIFGSVLPNFTCQDQNGKDCPGSAITVTITKPDNSTQVLTGPNYNYTYVLGMPGIFEYTLSGTCGGKKCECKFKVNIPNK